MLTVASVLRSGGAYTPAYVQHLAAQVAVHAPAACFVCLSDTPVPGVDTIPLAHDWPKWWPKIELFRPGLFAGTVLYLDLDTVLTGDVSEVEAYRGPRAVLADLYQPTKYIGSGAMLWRGDAFRDVWENFHNSNPKAVINSYQVRMDYYLGETLFDGADRLQDLYPGWVASYKADVQRKGLQLPPEGTRIVCFHGRPRPADLPETHPLAVAWRAVA